ncbi:MAG TPA: DUF3592 domain-containing protein [Thermoanaerobaculia bacterium]|jgi:hypothetical protein|nr:DUF3592 domain-containing protein [Thermoanaerobaculia bacterium]
MQITVSTPKIMSGRVGGTIFGVILLGLGLYFTGVVAKAILRDQVAHRRPPIDCVIESSRVEENPGAAAEGERFRVVFSYRYTAEGRERKGEVYREGYVGSSDLASAQRLEESYPEGARTDCYVDPQHPENVALQRKSLWGGLVILLPLLIAGIGAVLLILPWRKGTPPAVDGVREIPVGRNTGELLRALFFGLFLLVGLGLSVFFGRPVLRTIAARSWPEVPCTILYSAVRSHSGDDSTTYSVEAVYEYEIGGRRYKSSRYRFLGGSTSGYEGKAAVVARLPVGSRAFCFVDPKDSYNAVLDRSFGGWVFLLLVPLAFLAVGVGGVYAGVRKRFGRGGRADLPDEPTSFPTGRPDWTARD